MPYYWQCRSLPYVATSFSGRILGKKTCDHILVVKYFEGSNIQSHVVGPCQQDMARPQIADRGTVSDKDGSCE